MTYNLSALGVPSGAWAQHLRFSYEFVDDAGIDTAKSISINEFSSNAPSGFGDNPLLLIIDPREEPGKRPEEIGYRDGIVYDLHQRSMVLIIAYSSLKLTK